MSTRTRASPSTPGRRSSPSRSSSTSWPRWPGKTLDDYVKIVPCDPFYRIYFADGRDFDYVGRPGPARGRDRPVQPRRRRGLSPASWPTPRRSSTGPSPTWPTTRSISVWEMVKVAPDLIQLRADQSVYRAGLDVHQGPRPPPGLLVRAAPDRRQPAPVVVDLLDDPLPRKDLGRPLRDGRAPGPWSTAWSGCSRTWAARSS